MLKIPKKVIIYTMKILLLEDDKHLANMYSKKFKNEGWGTVICHDGYEALSKVKTEQYDAIILDLMLPGMSGLDVLQLLRQEKKTVTIPIIIYTNHGDKYNKDKCLIYGADEFILKIDSTPEKLTAVIKKFASFGGIDEPKGDLLEKI